jgi:hypothetical protein
LIKDYNESKNNYSSNQKMIIKKMFNDLRKDAKGFKIKINTDGENYYWKIDNGLTLGESNYSLLSSYFMFGIYENVYYTDGLVYFYNNNDNFITKANITSLLEWSSKTSDFVYINDRKCLELIGKNISDVNLGFKALKLKCWIDTNSAIIGGPTIFGNVPGTIIALENKFVRYELDKTKTYSNDMLSLKEFLGNKKILTIDEAEKYHKSLSESLIGG